MIGGILRPVVSVVAPANSMDDLSESLAERGTATLNQLGFDVRIGAHARHRYHHTAGTVAERLSDIHEALRTRDIRVIMAAFGGYNSNQLLHRLDYELIRSAGKSFVGYSDVTALLQAVTNVAGARAIHGPSFSVLCDPNLFDYTRDGLRRVLAGEAVTFEAPEFIADDRWYLKPGYGPRETKPFRGWRAYRDGESVAPITGGNLETLVALIGTPYFPRLNGKILFIEDTTGQKPGAFHRSLTQLSQVGVLSGLEGLIVGNVPTESQLADAALLDAILDDVLPPSSNYPVLCDVNCSHVDPMVSIPLEATATLRASSLPSLTLSP